MNSFFNYVKRFTRNRFYKFVLFFIIFCVISMCKGCKVYAWSNLTLNNASSYIKYHVGVLEHVGVNTLYTKNVNEYTVHFNGSDNIGFDIGTYGSYIRDIEVLYTLNVDTTISSSLRYIGFNFNNFLNYSNSGTPNNYFNVLNNGSSSQTLNLYTNYYNFVPFYVEYYDITNDEWKGAKVLFNSFSSTNSNNSLGNVSNYYLDIPVGTVLNKVRFRFGSLKNLITSEQVLSSHIYGSDLYGENYEVWFYPYSQKLSGASYLTTNTNETRYLAFFGFGTTQINNLLYLPSRNTYPDYNSIASRNNTMSDSSNGSNKLIYDFTDFDYSVYEQEISEENENAYQDILTQIEQDEAVNNATGDFNSSLGSFTDSGTGQAFTGLFSSMFIYPLEKLDDIKNEGLWGVNQGGNQYLNLALCTGTTLDGHFGDRAHIYITKDYYFELPCPHYDIYPKIKSGRFGFYSSSTTPDNFYIIYKTIIDGLLVYLLFVNILNIYKYVLDINDTKIEVLEL